MLLILSSLYTWFSTGGNGLAKEKPWFKPFTSCLLQSIQSPRWPL